MPEIASPNSNTNRDSTLDKAQFHSCIESNNESNNTDCASVSTLMKIVEEARQNQGKALLGHLNRSINLLINAAPGYLTGPLEVITTRNGDCKSHSIAKYAAARAAGFSADHVRLVTVHDRRHNFDHMVAVVYYNEEWLILDNLTNLLVRDSEIKRLRADGRFGLQGCPSLSFGVLDDRLRAPRSVILMR